MIEKPNLGPLVIAGDSLGYMTLLRKDLQSGQVQSVTFGAHADKKPNDVRRVLKLPGTLDLVSVGAGGQIRLWTS